jgi:molecular chaperone GrpE
MSDEQEMEDSNPGGAHDSSPEYLKQQLQEAQEEARTNLGGWQRAQADFENYKKRKENENLELTQFAKEVAVVKLLPTLDSLEQGLKHMPGLNADMRTLNQEFAGQYDKWKSGIEGTLSQLAKALAEMGVKKIEAAGKKFDPNYHEALREVPGEEDGMVVEEFQPGYEINGKVIRPSQVTISKKENNAS